MLDVDLLQDVWEAGTGALLTDRATAALLFTDPPPHGMRVDAK